MEPRQRLITRINRGGDFHGPETALPLVTLEEFFVGNDDAGSIGCNLPGGVLPREFHAALLVVRERPDVSDVRVQVTMHDDPDAWPFADTVWVVTSASPQAVRSWLPERLAPDEVFDGLPRDRLLESLPIPAGQRAVGLWYD